MTYHRTFFIPTEPGKLVKYLRRCKQLKKPMLLHAITTKGKGYPFAVENPEKFHGIAPFEIMTGKVSPERQKTCSEVFGETMLRLAEKNDKLIKFAEDATETCCLGFRFNKKKLKDEVEAAKAGQDIEVEIADFEEIVNATEADGTNVDPDNGPQQ